MSIVPKIVAALLGSACAASALTAQGVVVDEGTFSVEIDGVVAGTESFSIRRTGIGRAAAFFAIGNLTLNDARGPEEVRPLLRADASGAADGYQLKVSGATTLEIILNRAGPRFVSSFLSDDQEEEREFRAKPETRVLERNIAHQYYFLRDVGEGTRTPIIEPRSRVEIEFTVTAVSDEELTLGQAAVPTRHMTLEAPGGDVREVWFDRQGRVLRVSLPAIRYVAQRTDLIG